MAQFHIDNYQLLAKNRYASGAHGGLAFYIHTKWNFQEKTDIIESDHWVEMFVELTEPSNPSKVKFTVVIFIGHLTLMWLNYSHSIVTLQIN